MNATTILCILLLSLYLLPAVFWIVRSIIDTNEYVRSTADFYFAMESAGFERVTLNRKRYFKGVRLRTDMDDAGDDFLT